MTMRPTKAVDSVLTPCDGRHELFDSTDREIHKVAKAICRECPFREPCDRLAKDTMRDLSNGAIQGTWAGKIYGRPPQVITGPRIQPEPKPCGTLPAYRRHLRNGETPCEPCKAANGRRSQEHRDGRRNIECIDCGNERRHAGRGLCDPCHRRHKIAGTLDELYPTRNVFDGAA